MHTGSVFSLLLIISLPLSFDAIIALSIPTVRSSTKRRPAGGWGHFFRVERKWERRNNPKKIHKYQRPKNLLRAIPTPAAAPEARKIAKPGPVGVRAGVGIF
jgi:hypothetical protein